MQELISAVRAAAEITEEGDPRDENVIMVVPRSHLDRVEEGHDDLSGRGLEVLLLVARGLSNRQAARAPHLSEATVKRHLANIYPRRNRAPNSSNRLGPPVHEGGGRDRRPHQRGP